MIAKAMAEMLTDGRFTDQANTTHEFELKDILVVTPYNAQVRCLRERLPDEARIGTVDKFQGQEAPVVLYSMTSTSADEAPRGVSFLYDLNRLNVAVSRAQALACVVLTLGPTSGAGIAIASGAVLGAALLLAAGAALLPARPRSRAPFLCALAVAALALVLLVLRGLDRVTPRPGMLNVEWIISHPDMIAPEEAAGFDAVYAASTSWARRSASASAVARPIPLEAPVTTTTRPSGRRRLMD